MPVTVRRSFGIGDDPNTGGATYDIISQQMGGVIPDATLWYPVTGGTLEKNIERIDRNDEARGRRAATAPRPFRAAPVMTVPVAAYRSVVEKIARKTLGGGAYTPTGTAPAPITHRLPIAGFGASSLPTLYSQLVRDNLNEKMSGGAVQRMALSFPLDGEGTMEFELHGLYSKHYASAPPTAVFSGLSEDVLMLRDARVYLNSGSAVNEVQRVAITGAPTGGSFTLTFRGQTTAAIAFNALAAAVQSALEALTTIGTGNVAVVGTGPYDVTFQGALAGTDVPMMTADETGLTGGTDANVAVTAVTAALAGQVLDLQGFDFTWVNNITRRHYADRNVITQNLGSPAKTYKLWWPQENRIGASQDVTYGIQFGDIDPAQELAADFSQIQKIVFEVAGGPLGTTPVVSELLRITIAQGVHTGGGPEALSARDDLTARYEGGAFYSDADGFDVRFEVVNASATAIA